MRFSIVFKVAASAAAISFLGIIMAVIIYRGLQIAQHSLHETIDQTNPTATAAYEMKINVVETGINVLQYLDTADPQFRIHARTDTDEFRVHLERHARLARNPVEQSLNHQLGELFRQFEAEGAALMNRMDVQLALMADFADDARGLDDLIDEGLRLSTDPDRRQDKISGALSLEVNAAEVIAWLGMHLWSSRPEHRALLLDNIADFERELGRFRQLPLSAAERALARGVESRWTGIKHGASRILNLKQEQDRQLVRFITLRAQLDSLGESIYAQAVGGLQISEKRTAAAHSAARLWLVMLVPVFMVLSLGLVAVVARAVRRPVAQLMQGIEEFGRGNLDHRVPTLNADELGELGRGFNRMAAQLKAITVSKEQLEESEERYRSILEHMDEGYYEMDLAGRIVFHNPAFASITGCASAAQRGAGDLLPVHGESAEKLRRALERVCASGVPVHNVELEIIRKDGHRREVSLSIRPASDAGGTCTGFQGMLLDITERKRAERLLQRQALYDALTGLPNRYLFNDRLEQAVLALERSGEPFAVCILDLDHFKEINDTLGHAAGDSLLGQIAERLSKRLRESDTLARLGGDEFALILPGIREDDCEAFAGKFLDALDPPIELKDGSVEIRGSLGIALCPDHGRAAEELLKHADIAMYTAKRDGQGHALYAADRDPHSVARLTLVADMRHALETEKLEMHYQPTVRLSADRSPQSVEALLRWKHDARGPVTPAECIPAAERHGLIKPLTLWTIERVVRQIREWRAVGLEIPVAVNVSPVALRDARFVDQLLVVLDDARLPGNWLDLEITESAVMVNSQLVMERLMPLRRRGVRLVIDDFGTGYSSFNRLHDLEFDALKVDQSFVRDLLVDERDAMIVRAVIQLAHGLGLTVVAEGVESGAVCDRLAALGCDVAQGNYLSPPLPPAAVLSWFDQALGVRYEAER